MITFKTTKENMNLILAGKKKIELRKLDKKAIEIINCWKECKCFNTKLDFCSNKKVIFEVIETKEQYEVEITNFRVLDIKKNDIIKTLDHYFKTNETWNKYYENWNFITWISKLVEFETWLEEYYKNESHIVIYDLGKVEKI